MPRQTSVCRQLPQSAPNPARRTAKPSQLGQLAIAHHLARWYLAKYGIQRRSSALGRIKGVLISIRHLARLGLQMKPDRWSGK